MKNLYTLLCYLFCMFQIHAQYTSIPDANFEQVLIDQAIDSEGILDGQVLTSDIAVVNNLDISYSSITDLTGIQDFTNLNQLIARSVSFTTLDLSGLSNLQELILAFNYTLQSLNVTGCTALVDLDIKITGLDSLDLSTCTSLETIDMYKSFLTDLDVSGLTNLTSINANESYLQTLNAFGCTSLINIQISETDMNSLDLSNNTAITNFGLYDCSLHDLNLTNCTNLTNLSFYECRNLTNIDFTNCHGLESLSFNDFSSQITSFDISSLINLESITFLSTSITSLDASNNPNLTSIDIRYSSISNLDLRNGNNTNMNHFYMYNTNLSCVSVDDEHYATLNWDNSNNSIIFSDDCETLHTIENEINIMNVYPNPVVNNLHIALNNNQILQEITLLNLQGKKILSTTKSTINVSQLSAGYYFARIQTDQGKTIKKIIKK